MESEDLPLLFIRMSDLELLCGLSPFVVDVVRIGLWEYSEKTNSLFHIATKAFVDNTVVVTFVSWPGTPIVLEVRDAGFHQTTLARILSGWGGSAAAEVRFDE